MGKRPKPASGYISVYIGNSVCATNKKKKLEFLSQTLNERRVQCLTMSGLNENSSGLRGHSNATRRRFILRLLDDHVL